MKVLITSRSFGKASDEPFRIFKAGDIAYDQMGSDFDEEQFKAIIPDYDALVIGAHKFYPEDMVRCPHLKIICKHGTGVDNIDLDKAKTLGITVTNVPAMNADAVADLTFGHMLNISRGISRSNADIHNGVWSPFIGRDVYKKTLGLVGFGMIAKNVARRARGFSMNILAYDPFVKDCPEEFASYVTLADLHTLIKESDIISIHVPLNSETKDLFDKSRIYHMKKKAYLINTARGGIVNEEDLYTCLQDGHLSGAALDVLQDEPIKRDNKLLELENVVLTSHMGMHSVEAISMVSIICAQNVVKKLKGESPDFVVA